MNIHLFTATKKNIEEIYNLIVYLKETELDQINFPEIDETKLTNYIKHILKIGKIICVKDLDTEKIIGCCMYSKGEYFFSKSQLVEIQLIYIKKEYRNFPLVKRVIESVKKYADELPIYLYISTAQGFDAVFKKLGFDSMGGSWRYYG
tara:strand:+ start:793 stop:1236 length:444 start_codon:yes stop_codon:yes gene_type:complete